MQRRPTSTILLGATDRDTGSSYDMDWDTCRTLGEASSWQCTAVRPASERNAHTDCSAWVSLGVVGPVQSGEQPSLGTQGA